jgi:hypothetical protein
VLGGADAGNYVLVQPSGLTASITPRGLNVTATGIDKVYDGTTAAAVVMADDRLAGDIVTLSSTSAFLDKSAGTNKFVGVSGITLGGQDAGNYAANGSTGTVASVAKATLGVQITGVHRVYDGTTRAAVTLAAAPIGGDDVDLSYVSAAFADKHAGNEKAVSVAGIAASGADAANYVLSAAAGTTTASITPAGLNVGAIGQPRLYDGTTNATVVLTDDRVSGDDLTLAADAAFADSAGGTGKPIAITGIAIAAGADAGNYVLANLTAAATADVFGGPSAPPEPAPSTGTASLAPILPQPQTDAFPAEQSPVFDATPPAGFGSAPITGSAAGNAGAASGSVIVSLVRSSSRGTPGVVSVLVPQETAMSGRGFAFQLPRAIPRGAIELTLTDGSPLPTWLRYVPASAMFVATSPRAGAFPLELRVRVGGREWTVLISTQAT